MRHPQCCSFAHRLERQRIPTRLPRNETVDVTEPNSARQPVDWESEKVYNHAAVNQVYGGVDETDITVFWRKAGRFRFEFPNFRALEQDFSRNRQSCETAFCQQTCYRLTSYTANFSSIRLRNPLCRVKGFLGSHLTRLTLSTDLVVLIPNSFAGRELAVRFLGGPCSGRGCRSLTPSLENKKCCQLTIAELFLPELPSLTATPGGVTKPATCSGWPKSA